MSLIQQLQGTTTTKTVNYIQSDTLNYKRHLFYPTFPPRSRAPKFMKFTSTFKLHIQDSDRYMYVYICETICDKEEKKN